MGELSDVLVVEILHVQIVFPDIGDPISIGRELGEHQRGRLGLSAAQLSKLPG